MCVLNLTPLYTPLLPSPHLLLHLLSVHFKIVLPKYIMFNHYILLVAFLSMSKTRPRRTFVLITRVHHVAFISFELRCCHHHHHQFQYRHHHPSSSSQFEFTMRVFCFLLCVVVQLLLHAFNVFFIYATLTLYVGISIGVH